MIARRSNIKDRQERCCLTGRSQHGSRAALKRTNLCSNMVAGRILQTGVKITACFQIEQLTHIFAGGIFKGCALDDRKRTRFAIARIITGMQAFGLDVQGKSLRFLLQRIPYILAHSVDRVKIPRQSSVTNGIIEKARKGERKND